MATPLITEAIVDSAYRNEIQQHYYASDSEGHLLDPAGIDGELLPALKSLIERTDSPEVKAYAMGMYAWSGWHLGYVNTDEEKAQVLETCYLSFSLSPNNPAQLCARLILQGIDPVEARAGIMG
jgi:hypothetical protein